MGKQKVISVRVDQETYTEFENWMKQNGYRSVTEYIRDQIKMGNDSGIKQHEREQMACLICQLETDLQRVGIQEPQLRQKLNQMKEVIS